MSGSTKFHPKCNVRKKSFYVLPCLCTLSFLNIFSLISVPKRALNYYRHSASRDFAYWCRIEVIDRSSQQSCSLRKSVLGNFANILGKHLCQSLFFNKVADLKPATLLKKRLWQRCFPVIFVEFLRTGFYRTPLGDCFCIEITRIKKRQKELSGDYIIAKRVSCFKMFWNFSLNICFCKVEGHRNFEKFLRTHFLQNTSGSLLLNESMSIFTTFRSTEKQSGSGSFTKQLFRILENCNQNIN